MSLRNIAGLFFTGSWLMVGFVQAGGPAPENREGTFSRVCKAGPSSGTTCVDDTTCPHSTCEVVFERSLLTAVVTIIVDDDVSRWDHTHTYGQVHAATVLMEVRKDGTQLIAQTYQNLAGVDLDELLTNLRGGAFLADTFDPLTEQTLNAAATTPDLLGRFLFQSGDALLADRLRAIAGSTGQPIVVGVPRTLDQVAYDNHLLDNTASVVRIKVKIGFTGP